MTIASLSLTPEALLAGVGGLVLVLIVAFLIFFKFFRKVRPKKFRAKWQDLQKKLPNQEYWLEAVQQADKLLDEAMKKKKIKGSTMGERLVHAQKLFKDKDEVWFGHKLCKKHQENPNLKLKKNDVKRALVGLRQALKDLGAM
ncbi:MAG TPA: hypothetical protein VD947_01165 [Patescibacteria group bacterium]|nr:hypothetical protein [Patescibacteria group bacterium]